MRSFLITTVVFISINSFAQIQDVPVNNYHVSPNSQSGVDSNNSDFDSKNIIDQNQSSLSYLDDGIIDNEYYSSYDVDIHSDNYQEININSSSGFDNYKYSEEKRFISDETLCSSGCDDIGSDDVDSSDSSLNINFKRKSILLASESQPLSIENRSQNVGDFQDVVSNIKRSFKLNDDNPYRSIDIGYHNSSNSSISSSFLLLPDRVFPDQFVSNVELGVLEVPADYDNPDISINYVKYYKRPAVREKKGTMLITLGLHMAFGSVFFFNEELNTFMSSELMSHYDLIMVSPRGTDDSSYGEDYVYCYQSVLKDLNSSMQPTFGSRCSNLINNTSQYLTMETAVRDIESVRKLLAPEEKLDILSVSDGASVALTYNNLFPQNVRSIIIDSPSYFDKSAVSPFVHHSNKVDAVKSIMAKRAEILKTESDLDFGEYSEFLQDFLANHDSVSMPTDLYFNLHVLIDMSRTPPSIYNPLTMNIYNCNNYLPASDNNYNDPLQKSIVDSYKYLFKGQCGLYKNSSRPDVNKPLLASSGKNTNIYILSAKNNSKDLSTEAEKMYQDALAREYKKVSLVSFKNSHAGSLLFDSDVHATFELYGSLTSIKNMVSSYLENPAAQVSGVYEVSSDFDKHKLIADIKERFSYN